MPPPNARIGKIALMIGKSGGAERCVPPAGWRLNYPVNIYVLNAEQQIIIPARGADETLALVVELHGAKGKDSHGKMGLRRCR